MSFEVKGASAMIAKIQKATKEIQDKAEQGLADAANEVLAESRQQAPIDKGTLILTSGQEHTDKFERTVYYNTPYAPRLHEHPEYKFQRGRKGKFLEDPFKEMSGKLGKIIQEKTQV